MKPHPRVPHPRELLPPRGWQDRLIDWLTARLGASVITFWVAFVAPLLVLPLSDGIKLAVAVISGSWYQWWMLTGVQRSQVRDAARAEAKHDADHRALTHIAGAVDQLLARQDPP